MAKKSLEVQVAAIAPEIVNAALSMSDEELKAEITKRAMFFSGSKEMEKADEELRQAREAVKMIQAPYKEDQKATQLVITWITKLLEGRGKPAEAVSAD